MKTSVLKPSDGNVGPKFILMKVSCWAAVHSALKWHRHRSLLSPVRHCRKPPYKLLTRSFYKPQAVTKMKHTRGHRSR